MNLGFWAVTFLSCIIAISSSPCFAESSAELYFLITWLCISSLLGLDCISFIYISASLFSSWKCLLITHSLKAETISPVSKYISPSRFLALVFNLLNWRLCLREDIAPVKSLIFACPSALL